ncbi:hypothetical protein [Algoriphagus boritolerans]|uniref:hypothetical protein n=1 Tax=Algoriphagus boritolerans TaxID=308111 RepID=UPI000AB0AFE9
MKSRYVVFLILILSVGCTQERKTILDNNKVKLPKIINLEKLDSISIEYIGNPTVHDIDPITGTVLFIEHKEFSEEIFIADFEGKIHSSFSKMGDVPDGYGRLMSTLRINGKNSFIVYGYKGFITYDFEGKALSRVKPIDFQVPNYAPITMGYGLEKNRRKISLS